MVCIYEALLYVLLYCLMMAFHRVSADDSMFFRHFTYVRQQVDTSVGKKWCLHFQ